MEKLLARSPIIILLFMLLSSAVCSAASSDHRILALVPRRAQVVARMSAPRGEHTDSFLLMTHNNLVDLKDLYAITGVDSSRHIEDLILVSYGDDKETLDEHSLLVAGHFEENRIFRSALQGGAQESTYRSKRILIVEPFARERGVFHDQRWLTILDDSILLLGTPKIVREELDRSLDRAAPDPALLKRLARLGQSDTWCILSTPARSPEIRNALVALDPGFSELTQDGDGLEFGLRYGRRVEFEYEVTAAEGNAALFLSATLTRPFTTPGASNFRQPSTAGSKSAHGVLKLSRVQYEHWLKRLTARDAPAEISDTAARNVSVPTSALSATRGTPDQTIP